MWVFLKIHFNGEISFPHKFPEMCNVCCGLPGGMLGARSRPRPLPLSLVGWCVSCNNNNKY